MNGPRVEVVPSGAVIVAVKFLNRLADGGGGLMVMLMETDEPSATGLGWIINDR